MDQSGPSRARYSSPIDLEEELQQQYDEHNLVSSDSDSTIPLDNSFAEGKIQFSESSDSFSETSARKRKRREEKHEDLRRPKRPRRRALNRRETRHYVQGLEREIRDTNNKISELKNKVKLLKRVINTVTHNYKNIF